MNLSVKYIIKTLGVSAFVILSGTSDVSSEPLNLSDVPLFLQQSVPPAIALSFDNSSRTQKTSLFYVEDYEANPPRFREALASPTTNLIYFNPLTTYLPPLYSDGNPYPNSNYNAAWIDGFDQQRGLINLNSQYKLITNYNATNGQQNTFSNGNGNGEEAYYYEYNGGDNDYGDKTKYTLKRIPDNLKQNFANWFSYYKTRNMIIKSSASRAMGVLDEDFKIAWQSFKQNNAFEVDMLPLKGAHREALWDWLLTLKSGGSDAMNNAMIEAGESFENNHQWYYKDGIGSSVSDELECQQNFHVVLTNSYANGPSADYSSYTDHSRGSQVGNFTYSGSNESAIYYGQDNRTFSDLAFHYWSRDIHPHLKNGVPRYQGSNEDANGNPVPDLAGQEWWNNEKLFWNPENDPANWQHVVNFVIGFGLQGVYNLPEITEIDSDNDGITDDIIVENPEEYEQLRKGQITWPRLQGRLAKEAELDDMWHAALNSRGEFLNVTNPNQLTNALIKLLERLKTRRGGSSSVASVSTNIITDDATIYRTSFDATDWSGSLIAQNINADGTIGTIKWDAACLMTGGPCGALNGTTVNQSQPPSARKIFTYDRFSKSTKLFKSSNLTEYQKTQLNQSKFIQQDSATLEQLVNYLRGDQTLEESSGGVFRNRRVLLGDIIHSSAKVIRGPSESYNDDAFPANSDIISDGNLYRQFKLDNANRKNILLVGSNDGMLHAFDASSGKELWAYIPSQSFENMYKLADPDYTHMNYVDATPIVRDIYINDEWKTVALGGLRLGGQGFYALDITAPESPKVMWEFTDDSDSDMGFSYGEPFITRLKNNKWVALLPNGYNNVIEDGNVGAGDSVLFMIDMETGLKIKEFNTGIGNYDRTNGMAGAVVSDVPYDITGDTVYVGDLRGDIYRIDLTDPSFPMDKMADSIDPYKTPITTPLKLSQYLNFSNSTNDIMVHFGTGKFIEAKDKTDLLTDPQYVGAIFDKGQGSQLYPFQIVDNDRFVVQYISTDGDQRTISDNFVDKTNDYGWYVKLPAEGERVIAKMATRASAHILVYSSYLPTANSGCSTGGASWVMAVDNRTGGQPSGGSLLADGTADGLYVENQVLGITPIGFAGGGGEILIISTDDSGTNCEEGEECSSTTISIPDFTWRRRSWNRIDN